MFSLTFIGTEINHVDVALRCHLYIYNSVSLVVILYMLQNEARIDIESWRSAGM